MSCNTCEYTGWVVCLKSPALRYIADNFTDTLPLYWWMHVPQNWFAAVVCTCRANADEVARRHDTVVYDPQRTCKLYRNTSEQNGCERDRWILEFVQRKLANQGVVASTVDDWEPPVQHQSSAWD
jgi:hypothetical protein